MIAVYVDGLCEPVNPNGVACWGFSIYKEGVKKLTSKGVIGEGKGMSNNLAEYTALCEVLRKLLNWGWQNEKIVVYSDSQLLVDQMTGRRGAHGGLYYPAFIEASKLVQKFRKISFIWIPREKNVEADALSREAYEEYCKEQGRKPEYYKPKYPKSKLNIPKETCLTCKWIRFSGPHATCTYGGTWKGWMPKKFYTRSRCEHYERRSES